MSHRVQKWRGLPTVAAIAAVALAVRPALAEDKPELVRMRFFESPTKISVSASITKLFDSAAYDDLDNGIPSTIVIRLWVYPADKTQPIAFTVLEREVFFEIWTETFAIRLSDARGTRLLTVKHKAEALKILTSLDNIPIADASLLPIGKHHLLAMVVELNPLSQQTLAEVRRWLSDGADQKGAAGGRLFNDVVRIFLNYQVPQADRVLRISSQPFYRPEPKKGTP